MIIFLKKQNIITFCFAYGKIEKYDSNMFLKFSIIIIFFFAILQTVKEDLQK